MMLIWEDMEPSFRYADFEMSMELPGRDIKETLRSGAQGNDSF